MLERIRRRRQDGYRGGGPCIATLHAYFGLRAATLNLTFKDRFPKSLPVARPIHSGDRPA